MSTNQFYVVVVVGGVVYTSPGMSETMAKQAEESFKIAAPLSMPYVVQATNTPALISAANRAS